MKIKRLYAMALIFCAPVSYASEFLLTEQSVLELAKTANPTLADIERGALGSSLQEEEVKDKLGFELYGGYNHKTTKEKGIIPFQPVFDSSNQYQLGVKKYTKYGAVIDLNASVDTRSSHSGTSSYKDLTTTTYSLGIDFDLWKDFLGRITKSQLNNLSDIKKKDQLQKEISIKNFENNVRRIYWQFISNEEKLKITRGLYRTAVKQAKNAKKRRANSISDTAEVARFESLVHQRKGQLIFLEYEKEVLSKRLRDLFPVLADKKIKLQKYNLKKSSNEILGCSMKIIGMSKTPYQFTPYDEVTSLLKEVQGRQKKIDSTYDDIDLKLSLGVSQVGVGSETEDNTNYAGNFDRSLEDMSDNDRGGFRAGLVFSIPFGEDKSGTKKIKDAITERQFSSQIQKLDVNVISTHQKIRKSMQLLAQVIREQKLNSKKLALRVKEMKKKYRQARIPEYVLIQDEDSLLQSDLTVIDTQLLIANTILDYFSVFNTYPCAFNRN